MHAMIASLLMTVPLDMRYGLRRLNNNIGFTVVAVACLSLGICACTTVFSVVNALLLRPLPGAADPGRLVSLMSKATVVEGMGDEPVDEPLSYPVFLRYREAGRVFSSLVAYQTVSVNLVLAEEPLRVKGQVVTGNYFATLGLRPAAGRFFITGEEGRGAPPQEVVISHALWRGLARRRGLGGAVILNGQPFTVVGVAPPGFRGIQLGDDLDVWIPLESAPLVHRYLQERDLRDPEKGWLFGFFGRLAPGVDLRHAQREMDLLPARLFADLPAARRPPALQLYPGLRIRPGTRVALTSPLALLAGVVGLLMLVVCANLGGLLLVKAAARQEEIGVRLALGVTRGQLVRQLLAESVALALLGGTVGFVTSLWTVEALRGRSLGRYLPRIDDLSMDGRVVAFTLAVSLGAGVLFGLVPALWSTRRRGVPFLRRGGDSAGPERGRILLQELFIVAQVTVSLLLLITTGLFVRTLRNLESIDPGFDSESVVNVRLNLDLVHYPEATGREFFERLLPQVRRLPGVRDAALVSWVPLSRGNDVGRVTSLRPHAAAGTSRPVWSQGTVVLPGYFQTLGIPLLDGRDFLATDGQGSNPVLIVDETLAGRLWPGRSPVGEQVELTLAGRSEVREVVGVSRGVRLYNLDEPPRPLFYLPLAQHYEPSMALQVRTDGQPLRAVDAIRAFLRKQEPALGVEVSRFDREVKETLAQPKLLSWLLGSFSLTALLVTAIGLYGTLAYAVSRRTRELGIRIALGARSFEIVRMVLRRGLTLTVIGLVLGLTAASWTTSAFSSLLFGVTPTDPGVFVSVTFLLVLVGLAASSLPAYSATRIDPMAIIRHE